VQPVNANAPLTPIKKDDTFFTLTHVFQALAIASNLAAHLAPLRGILEIRRYKDTQDRDGLPYLAIMACAFQWVFYGFFAFCVKHNTGFFLLVFANMSGVLLGAFYVHSFQRNCNDQVRAGTMMVYYRCMAAFFAIQFLAMTFLSHDRAIFLAGLHGSILSVGVTASPLFDLHTVLKSKDTSCWPLEMIYVNTGGLCLWIICGVILADKWVLIPNSIGLVISCFQLGCIFYFGSDPAVKAKKIRKDTIVFHVVDETSPIVPSIMMTSVKDGKSDVMEEQKKKVMKAPMLL
jgi:solute carrier family 50 protein (sugar transporter)